MLGLSYDGESRFAEAQRAYQKAIVLDPKIASYHDNLGVSYLRSGNGDAGAREFERAIDVAPRDQTSNLNLGAYALSAGQYRRALGYYRVAHAEQSRDPEVLLGMVQAEFGAGERASGRELAARLSAAGGSDAKVHFSLGLLLAESGEYRMAVNEFQAIPPGQRDSAAALNIGMAFSKLGDLGAARQSYQEAIRLDPSNIEAFLRLGVEVAGDNANDAVYWLSQAHEKAPERPDISCLLSEQLIRVRNFERADQILEAAVQQHGGDPMVWQALGDLRAQQRRSQDAVAAYRQCLKLDSRNVNARLALAELERTGGEIEASTQEVREVLRLAPDNAAANAQLARNAFDAGRTDDALLFARRCLAKDPDNLTANEVLAELMVRNNNFTAARSILERMVKLSPDNPRYHYLLSRVLFKLNLRQEAQSEAELSEKLQGGGPAANPR